MLSLRSGKHSQHPYSKLGVCSLIIAFSVTSLNIPMAMAQAVPYMPVPGTRVGTSPQFNAATITGMVIHPDNALRFDFLINANDDSLSKSAKQEEYIKLVKYFMASLTVADSDQWVNLSPYEKNRVVNPTFGNTQMGRDLLAQDYLLKQISASLMYPEENLGKKFWNRVYERSKKEFGATDIPVNTINKVWIVPDKAEVFEKDNTVVILNSNLKVMLEEDYVALEKNSLKGQQGFQVGKTTATKLNSDIVREIILPELQKEVNEGKNFAPLRQMYSAMILSTWFKKALKESLLGKVYSDKNKLLGVELNQPKANEEIYQQYLKAYKKGAFNYIKEEIDTISGKQLPKKYFSGGINKAMTVTSVPQNSANQAMASDKATVSDLVEVGLDDAAMKTVMTVQQAVTATAVSLRQSGFSDAEINSGLSGIKTVEDVKAKAREMIASRLASTKSKDKGVIEALETPKTVEEILREVRNLFDEILRSDLKRKFASAKSVPAIMDQLRELEASEKLTSQGRPSKVLRGIDLLKKWIEGELDRTEQARLAAWFSSNIQMFSRNLASTTTDGGYLFLGLDPTGDGQINGADLEMYGDALGVLAGDRTVTLNGFSSRVAAELTAAHATLPADFIKRTRVKLRQAAAAASQAQTSNLSELPPKVLTEAERIFERVARDEDGILRARISELKRNRPERESLLFLLDHKDNVLFLRLLAGFALALAVLIYSDDTTPDASTNNPAIEQPISTTPDKAMTVTELLQRPVFRGDISNEADYQSLIAPYMIAQNPFANDPDSVNAFKKSMALLLKRHTFRQWITIHSILFTVYPDIDFNNEQWVELFMQKVELLLASYNGHERRHSKENDREQNAYISATIREILERINNTSLGKSNKEEIRSKSISFLQEVLENETLELFKENIKTGWPLFTRGENDPNFKHFGIGRTEGMTGNVRVLYFELVAYLLGYYTPSQQLQIMAVLSRVMGSNVAESELVKQTNRAYDDIMPYSIADGVNMNTAQNKAFIVSGAVFMLGEINNVRNGDPKQAVALINTKLVDLYASEPSSRLPYSWARKRNISPLKVRLIKWGLIASIILGGIDSQLNQHGLVRRIGPVQEKLLRMKNFNGRFYRVDYIDFINATHKAAREGNRVKVAEMLQGSLEGIAGRDAFARRNVFPVAQFLPLLTDSRVSPDIKQFVIDFWVDKDSDQLLQWLTDPDPNFVYPRLLIDSSGVESNLNGILVKMKPTDKDTFNLIVSGIFNKFVRELPSLPMNSVVNRAHRLSLLSEDARISPELKQQMKQRLAKPVVGQLEFNTDKGPVKVELSAEGILLITSQSDTKRYDLVPDNLKPYTKVYEYPRLVLDIPEINGVKVHVGGLWGVYILYNNQLYTINPAQPKPQVNVQGPSLTESLANGDLLVAIDTRVGKDVGGIDLNAANLDLYIKRDGKGVPLPLAQQDWVQMQNIPGFVPQIIDIRPAANMPLFSNIEPAEAEPAGAG